MTVAQLIIELSLYPHDATVMKQDPNGYNTRVDASDIFLFDHKVIL